LPIDIRINATIKASYYMIAKHSVVVLLSSLLLLVYVSAFNIAKKDTQRQTKKMSNTNDESNDMITILGFGSLLSEQSSRMTFPTLKNFRLGRVHNHRRVFAHPASIFFQRGIANLDSLQMSSLSCEYVEGSSFICSVFDVPNEGLSSTNTNGNNWIPSQAFLEREEEFDIAMVPYEELDISSSTSNDIATVKKGVICRRSTDESYISQWGIDHFNKQYKQYGVDTIWGYDKKSGLRPCPVYLRHCVLASWNCGKEKSNDNWSIDGKGGLCYESFLDETYLVDRKTTIRQYLKQYPKVMNTQPPEELKERYGG